MTALPIANFPLHGGLNRTRTICHWQWNVELIMRKARSTPQTWIALGKLVATYNFAASLFCLHKLYLVAVVDVVEDGSWKQAQTYNSGRVALAVEIWFHMCQLASTAWKNNCGTMAPLPMALGQLARQANLLLVEIGKYAIGRAMSNQQWWLPATSQLHLFLLYTISTQDHFRPC